MLLLLVVGTIVVVMVDFTLRCVTAVVVFVIAVVVTDEGHPYKN